VRRRLPDDEEAILRELGRALRGEASRFAERLAECGADETSLFWPQEQKDRREEEMVCIPPRLADLLLTMLLFMPKTTLGRPPKTSTLAARVLAECFSQREAASIIATETGECPEIVRGRITKRKKTRARKPRRK
jgi:hypothetical protein